MHAYLQQNPQANAHLKMDAVIFEAIASIRPETEDAVLAERFMQRWHAAKPAASRTRGLWPWLRQTLRIPAAVVAALACLQLGQLAYFAFLTLGTTYTATRSIEKDCNTQPLIRVSIQPNATWEDVALLIRKNEVTISQGPSESGEVWLAVPANRSVEAARRALSQSPLLEQVVVVPVTKDSACAP